MDHASNRFLSSPATPGESAYLNLNAFLMRHTPTFELDLQPNLSVQRFTTGTATDSFNRSLAGMATSLHEHWSVGLTAAYSDLSTLNTELTSTGLIQGTRQRSENGGGSWQWQQSPKRQLTVSLSYADVSYVGQYASLLPGYKYPGVSVGERFTLAEYTSLTVSGSAGQLRSSQYYGNVRESTNIRDEEVSLELDHTFSEQLSGVVGFGRNDRSANGRTHGYVGQASLTWKRDERNRWKLAYVRTVSPTGFGVLAQRDDASLYFSRDLAEHLSGSVGVGTSRDDEGLSSIQFSVSRRYEYARTSLNWLSGETSTVSLQAGYDRVTTGGNFPAPPARGWSAGLGYTWKPLPQILSR